MSNTPNCAPTARRATGEPDPIFAAIERHRAARRGWLATYDRLGVLQEMAMPRPANESVANVDIPISWKRLRRSRHSQGVRDSSTIARYFMASACSGLLRRYSNFARRGT